MRNARTAGPGFISRCRNRRSNRGWGEASRFLDTRAGLELERRGEGDFSRVLHVVVTVLLDEGRGG